MDIVYAIVAVAALIAVVVYVIYRIDQGNRTRPPRFVRAFTLFPRAGCPGTIATINWETIDDYARTLTRQTSAGISRVFVASSGPITEPVTETTTFTFEATKQGHPPVIGSGTFTVFGDGATEDVDGLAHCQIVQTPAGVFDAWLFGKSFDPALWHPGLKVRSISLITSSPQHRRSVFVVHDNHFDQATQLTEADPTVTFNEMPLMQGDWQLYTPRRVEERCNENDTRPDTIPYEPVNLGVTMTVSC